MIEGAAAEAGTNRLEACRHSLQTCSKHGLEWGSSFMACTLKPLRSWLAHASQSNPGCLFVQSTRDSSSITWKWNSSSAEGMVPPEKK